MKCTDTAPVISVAGAGGKTTTIERIAQNYREQGRPVIVTTTTHMAVSCDPRFLLEPSMEKLAIMLRQQGWAWVGLPAENGKMKAVPEGFLKQILAMKLPVLIEADGARGLPCKAPAAHEPVIIPETTHVLSVYGLDAVGGQIKDVCCRPQETARILNKSLSDRILPEDIAVLGLSPRGGRKNVGENMKYSVILNKADDTMRRETAAEICREFNKRGFTDVFITAKVQV